jgi:hypothetical protein
MGGSLTNVQGEFDPPVKISKSRLIFIDAIGRRTVISKAGKKWAKA